MAVIMDFNSIEDLARESDKHTRYGYRLDRENVWADGSEWNDLMHKAQYGDPLLVPKAEALLDKLDVAVHTENRQIEAVLCGGFPSVPDYLADRPECMRRMHTLPSDMSPVTVWYYMSVSSAIGKEAVMNRGLSALALVLKLQQTRAVYLKLVDNGPGLNRVTVNINTQPLVLSTLTWALTTDAYTRRMIYNLPANIDMGGMLYTQAQMRQFLPEAGPKDVLIPGAYLGANDQLSDPVAWIKAELAKLDIEND